MNTHKRIAARELRNLCGGVSDMTIWRYLHDPYLNFPKPIYIKKRRYWQETEVISWLESQKQSSSRQPAARRMTAFGSLKLSNRERDDGFSQVVVQLAPRWRVVVCKDHIQWIIQKRTAEPLHRGVWRGHSYMTNRSSLIRLCATLGLLSDDTSRATLDALPAKFSELYKK